MSWKIGPFREDGTQLARQELTSRSKNVVQSIALGVQSAIALLVILGVLNLDGTQVSGIILASAGITAAAIGIGTFGKVDPNEIKE